MQTRREKAQSTKVRNEGGEVTTHTKKIQGIISDYFENVYSDKLEKLEEMNKFLDSHDYPKLNQDDNNHL
jgi:hypothetical protein